MLKVFKCHFLNSDNFQAQIFLWRNKTRMNFIISELSKSKLITRKFTQTKNEAENYTASLVCGRVNSPEDEQSVLFAMSRPHSGSSQSRHSSHHRLTHGYAIPTILLVMVTSEAIPCKASRVILVSSFKFSVCTQHFTLTLVCWPKASQNT